MNMPWFRLYAEFAGDVVIQSLSFEDQRHYVMVLCLKSSGLIDRNISEKVRESLICRALGLDEKVAQEVKIRLKSVGLIEKNWQPKGWDKRQFVSDQSTERVRKYRKSKKTGNVSVTLPETFHETLHDRYCNGPEQNRTETDLLKKEEIASLEVTTEECGPQPIRKDAYLDHVVEVLEAFGVNGNRYALAEELRQEYRESEVLRAIAEMATSKTEVKTPVGFVRGYLKKNFLKRGQVSL